MDLRDILGIEYPLIQGGMANIATGSFAAAISNAGGLGLVGAGGMNAEQLREHIHIARSLTDRPFGVNIMLMSEHAADCAKLLVEEQVPIVTTGAGDASAYMPMWKAAGMKIFPVIASTTHARLAERNGADGVIAEGTESGGHVGELTTMVLVSQVSQTVQIPVVAAGGIACGRQLAAAFVLGACGAQLGTALLLAEECPIHDNYKQAVIKAKDIDTVVTGRNGGVPVRILRNAMAKDYLRREKEGASKEELERFTLGSLRRAVFDGDTQTGSLMSGQVAGSLSEIKPARQILAELWAGCGQRLAEMQPQQFV